MILWLLFWLDYDYEVCVDYDYEVCVTHLSGCSSRVGLMSWMVLYWWVCNDVIGISSPDSTAEDALFWHTLLSEQTLISMCVCLCFYSYGSLLAIIWNLNLVCFLLYVVGVVVWVKLLHPSMLQPALGYLQMQKFKIPTNENPGAIQGLL